MATKISTELLIMILNNIQSTQDLYSSLLVNRIWCKVTIPILWELSFCQEFCKYSNRKLKKKALFIRTYISCMDTQARTLLAQNGFDLTSSPPQAIFDYPSFAHKFIIDYLSCFVSIYSQQQIIGSDKDNNKNYNSKSRILFREICKLIINRCTFLDYFKLGPDSKGYFLNYSDLIGSILKLHGAPKVFKKLESFTSMIENYEPICPLYESLALICENILNMDLSLSSNSQAQLLAELISSQNHLENLSIGAIDYLDCNSIIWAIISQKKTLKSLRLIKVSLSFKGFKGKSSRIGQFISLQELYIEDCPELNKSDCLFLASSFTQLNSFHFIYATKAYPQNFIMKILETANTNLRNIYSSSCHTISFDIFSSIINNCTKITELILLNLSPEQVIAIFNNNFNELRRFSFNCGEEFDANELLFRMAKNVPESLETIEIIMCHAWIFSADSLRNFFERWYCKGEGRDKNIIVKLTKQARVFRFSHEHLKIIEEYGVKFKFKVFLL